MTQPVPRASRKPTMGTLLILSAAVAMAVVTNWAGSSREASRGDIPAPTSQPIQLGTPAIARGMQGHLKTPSGEPITLAQTADDFRAVVNAMGLHDTIGERQLLASGRFSTAPSGSSVLLLDWDWLAPAVTMSQVRVLDGPTAGQAGWIGTTWLVP